jgi:hypothetical protein
MCGNAGFSSLGSGTKLYDDEAIFQMSTSPVPKSHLGARAVGLMIHKDVGAGLSMHATLTASLWSVQMPTCFLLVDQGQGARQASSSQASSTRGKGQGARQASSAGGHVSQLLAAWEFYPPGPKRMLADRGEVGSLEHHVVDYAHLVPASQQPESEWSWSRCARNRQETPTNSAVWSAEEATHKHKSWPWTCASPKGSAPRHFQTSSKSSFWRECGHGPSTVVWNS